MTQSKQRKPKPIQLVNHMICDLLKPHVFKIKMVSTNPNVTIILDQQRQQNSNWLSLHQCLLMLFDSPLNHAGYLQVFINLADGRLIKLHREVRIPRTFKRFQQLFDNFLQGCDMPIVQTKDGHVRLLQFVGKSIEKHLQGDCKVYRICNLTPKIREPNFFPTILDTSKRIAIFVDISPVDFNILGDGKETEYEVKTFRPQFKEETYSMSRYPLSPSLTCVKLMSSFEKALEVL